MSKQIKYLFVTGGVISSLGKGITAASIAFLLKRRGYKVKLQKLDPYLNVDPGTMSPLQHGEVYVTEDGAETDLDLGHYERFSEITCSQNSNYTAGKIYQNVLERERQGGYLGGTVQVIPHITDEIKKSIASLEDDDTDIIITEIGGTAGDIESLPFLEAIRQFRQTIGQENGLFIHLTLILYINAAKELKTKPSQQSVGLLREIGIMPDMLICRSDRPLEEEHIDKLSMFCNVKRDFVIQELDVQHTIYEVPLELSKQKVDLHILDKLNLPSNQLNIADWKDMVNKIISFQNLPEVKIAIIGKYASLKDAYKSIYESLEHASIRNKVKINILTVDADNFLNSTTLNPQDYDGILVPGGFGDRGIEGKIKAVQFARINKIPFFGICLGMQCAVIETARNVANLTDAHSEEFNKEAPHQIIHLMEEQKKITNMGGTMRLGAYPCTIKKGTLAKKCYDTVNISERHRHRYEFNNSYRQSLEQAGLIISGTSPDNKLVEIIERLDHPFFIACQFHPEFKSSPLTPHPIFTSFVEAAHIKSQ